jgi:hypothetical protein
MTTLLKSALLGTLLLWQLPDRASAPDAKAASAHLRYQRTVFLPTAGEGQARGQACATLDAQVFAHAAPSLKDLRLFHGAAELPYATTLSEPLQQENEDARILNLGLRDHRIVFDLAMPRHPYTDVLLNLQGKDFLATATVAGETAPALNASGRTEVGSFTLFDLSSQHLSRNTNIPLPELSFPYLHVELAVAPAPGASGGAAVPGMLLGATVPPSREAQTVYTTAQQSSAFTQRGRQTVATFALPVHVPIERVSFVLAPGYKGNFSRSVRIDAQAQPAPPRETAAERGADPEPVAAEPETVTATILRVHTTETTQATRTSGAVEIPVEEEELSVPVAIGSNMQRPAKLEVAVDNGDDPPLPLAAVRLEMRQRRICFDPAAVTQRLTLDYGDAYGGDAYGGDADSGDDAALQAPVYDYAKLFRPAATPVSAWLEPEHLNPGFRPPADSRPFTERHPELLWVVLLGVLIILATVALRSARSLIR